MANSLVFLCLALFALSASADVDIDCGASGIYTDDHSLVWIGDDSLIQNGEAKTVQSGSNVDNVMRTLRVFFTRKKNCYTVAATKGEQVLVRASFFYGNYDQKSAPPTFDLQFDGNHWGTVETSSEDIVFFEAVYVAKDSETSVCVAQTAPNQFPFISALQVRSLASNMYSHVDAQFALFLKTRIAYGANTTIRAPDDAYDRIWVPAAIGNGLNKVTSDALFIDVNVADDPPQAAVQNAITTSSTSEYIVLGTKFLPTEGVSVYINMYFSEVSQLHSSQNRSFLLYIDNKPQSATIVPPYGSVSEFYISNMSASSNTSLYLVATNDSTLPPLINAMEVFLISDPLTYGTNSNDVEALGLFQTQFSVLQEWSGDPCLPASFTWDWINCSTDATPRVTALYLSGFDISGPLPDFSSLDALQIIDLHNNSISGPIPDFLGKFPNLEQLNLADNGFSGTVPASLSQNKNLKLDLSGNPELCVSGNSCQTTTDGTTSSVTRGRTKQKKNKLPVVLGSSIPSFVALCAIVGAAATWHRRRKTAAVGTVSAGQAGGVNKPHGTPQSGKTGTEMVGKMVKAAINEIKVNIKEQITSEIENQIDEQIDEQSDEIAQNNAQQRDENNA